jgi:hypothetical protein
VTRGDPDVTRKHVFQTGTEIRNNILKNYESKFVPFFFSLGSFAFLSLFSFLLSWFFFTSTGGVGVGGVTGDLAGAGDFPDGIGICFSVK